MILTEGMFQTVLPLACAWAEQHERIILRDGVALTAAQAADARQIGIAYPQRVRLRVVDQLPLPEHPLLRQAAKLTGMLSPLTAGLTVRYGIFIRSDCWGDRRLVVHELAHTFQYERSGGFRPFLEQYLRECITPPGYPFGALEQEAKQIEERLAESS